MALQAGDRIGPYIVGAQLGVGGMGEVYRAHDTKLDRDVAIKIISPAFTADPARLARFEREARTLASLNHTNIAHVYGLEHSEAGHALVMEVVEGEDLSQRLTRGPLAVDDALPIARQLAEAIEAAHELGIVHRDLKPANIKVRADGVVKVLDFGLAKALDVAPSGSGPHPSTMTSPAMTQAGVILGTAAYMSPEQAKGRPVDKRADIWAFGCVVFEMLAGRRPFGGEDFADTLSAIMRDSPSWEALSKDTPARLRDLLARCLEKDPRKRLRDVGEARVVLESDLGAVPHPPEVTRPASPSATRAWLRGAAWLIGGALLGAGAMFALRPNVDEAPLALRATIPLPSTAALYRDSLSGIAMSLDGRKIVYASQQGGSTALFLRELNGGAASKLAGTDGGSLPFFSAKGDQVGFLAAGELKRVPVAGGTAVTIASVGDDLRGPLWTEDDWVIFSIGASGGLSRVKAAGGAVEVLTTPDRAAGEKTHRFPEVLPGGRAVVFTSGAANLTSYSDARIVVRDLQSGAQHTLVEGGVNARFVAPGSLVYAKAGALYAVAFNPLSLKTAGAPVQIQDNVSMAPTTGTAEFGVSRAGLLVYAPGGEYSSQFRLVWVDRSGRPETILDNVSAASGGVLSPDQRHILLLIGRANDQLVSYDLARRTPNTLTTSWDSSYGAWSEDGRVVFFVSNKARASGALFGMSATGGTAELLLDQPVLQLDRQVRGDMLAIQVLGATTRDDIWTYSVASRAAKPFLAGPSSEMQPSVSPDGRFLAFSSDRSGRYEVYVAPMDAPSVWIPVSSNGGRQVRWSWDGKSLFYRDGSRLMSVRVSAGASGLTAGAPALVFDDARYHSLSDGFVYYDVGGDGRFIMVEKLPGAAPPTELVVVTDWMTEFKRKLAGR
jgi:eukaryotic-like serine/threonine-protein kinase